MTIDRNINFKKNGETLGLVSDSELHFRNFKRRFEKKKKNFKSLVPPRDVSLGTRTIGEIIFLPVSSRLCVVRARADRLG